MSFFSSRPFLFAVLFAFLLGTPLPVATKVLLTILLVRELNIRRGLWLFEQFIVITGEAVLMVAVTSSHLGLIGGGFAVYTASLVFIKERSAYYQSFRGSLQALHIMVAAAILNSNWRMRMVITLHCRKS